MLKFAKFALGMELLDYNQFYHGAALTQAMETMILLWLALMDSISELKYGCKPIIWHARGRGSRILMSVGGASSC
jgi:hypothetical protein